MLRGFIPAISLVYVNVRIGITILSILAAAASDIAFVNQTDECANAACSAYTFAPCQRQSRLETTTLVNQTLSALSIALQASTFVSLAFVLITTETQQSVQADGLQHRMLRGVISALSVVYVHV